MKNVQELKNTFGRNIRTRRDSKGWNQEELSVKAGVSKNTISDIETGQKFARANTLFRLAKAFDTEVYELLKPENVYPDKGSDLLKKYTDEVKDSVEKIGNLFLEKKKK